MRRAGRLGPLAAPVCSKNCADYDPAVGCYRFCPSAPRVLSSEKDADPVEPLIAPLVFELKRLAVFHPCWSCEGHNDDAGNLLKIPRVWFYADSVVHLRVLANAVAGMHGARMLSTCWQVAVTHSDNDNPDTTFSLEPAADGGGKSLQELQRDARVIADNLEPRFREAGASLLQPAR